MNGVLFMHWAPSLDPFGSRAKQALAIQKALNTGLSTVQVVLQHFLCFYFSLYSQWVNESTTHQPFYTWVWMCRPHLCANCMSCPATHWFDERTSWPGSSRSWATCSDTHARGADEMNSPLQTRLIVLSAHESSCSPRRRVLTLSRSSWYLAMSLSYLGKSISYDHTTVHALPRHVHLPGVTAQEISEILRLDSKYVAGQDAPSFLGPAFP